MQRVFNKKPEVQISEYLFGYGWVLKVKKGSKFKELFVLTKEELSLLKNNERKKAKKYVEKKLNLKKQS